MPGDPAESPGRSLQTSLAPPAVCEDKCLVGIISDTHGTLRPEALEALKGSDVIIHAGDIGRPEILDTLREIAPVVAVRGNNDRDRWARGLPETAEVEAGGVKICVIHDIRDLEADFESLGFRVLVRGHSHRASIKEKDGVLQINPGSAGPKRFGRPVTVALLRIQGRETDAEVIDLKIS